MRDKSVSTNSSLNSSSWLNGFLTAMSDKFSSTKTAADNRTVESELSTDRTLVAEVNINDLSKVVWNDETFYVMFDDQGASVFNEFGNVVTTLKGVHTPEEVDQALNSKQVVLSSNEGTVEFDDFQSELAKVLPYLNETQTHEASIDVVADEFDPTNTSSDDSSSAISDTADTTDMTSDTGTPNASVTPGTDSSMGTGMGGTPTDTSGDDSSDDVINTTGSLQDDAVLAAIMDGFSELEAKFAELQEQHQQLGQEYARLQELVNVDNGAAAIEQKHFEEASAGTVQEIEKEHNVDLTTPAGRAELSQQELQDSTSVKDENNEVQSDSENKETTVSEETDEKDSTVDSEKPAETKDQVKDESETNSEDNKEEASKEVEPLNAVEAKVFKRSICVACGEDKLVKSAKVVKQFQGVYCSHCNQEYAVNLSTEEIYIHN